MGGCLNTSRTNTETDFDSCESCQSMEMSWYEKPKSEQSSPSSVIFKRPHKRFASCSTHPNPSPRISQMVNYFCTDKAMPTNGIFSSLSAYSSCDASSLNAFMHLPLTKITPQLFIGSLEDAMNEAELQANGITHTISLIGAVHPIAGIKHKHTPMNDYGKSDLKRIMTKLWQFVELSQQPGNALFVHCMSGQNRSATVVIAILMKIQEKRLTEAFRTVKKKRPIVQINEGYGKQLISMELELFGKTSVPENWMQIDSYDMNTGKVTFVGESPTSRPSHRYKIIRAGTRCTTSETYLSPYGKNSMGSLKSVSQYRN